jgi:type I restriction enzyme, S subunit
MEKQMNIPPLRFPEFEGEWEMKKLGEVAEKIGDGLHGTPIYSDNSDIYFINGNNLTNGKIEINDNTKKVDISIFEKSNKGLNQNTILISINGTIGNIAKYNNEKVMLGKSVGYFNFNENTDFYYHIFHTDTIQNYFISELTGSTIKNLSLKTLRETEISLPTLPEQSKIASFLTAVDEKLQALKKKKSLLGNYKKGIMQKLFSQQLRFKPARPSGGDENGKDFPEWEMKKLGEVLIKNSNKNKNQKYSLVQSVSNKHGFINQDEMFEDRRVASKDTSNYYVIEKGHFAYNPSRIDVGSLAYKFDDEISTISPLYISFRAKKESLIDEYLLKWFSTEQFLMQMNNSFEGSVRNTLNYESLVRMKISIPSLPEQALIANFLSSIDEKITQTQTQISQTQTWKKGLLQKMFV